MELPGPGLRTRQLESLAKDIERFDPTSRDANIDDYLREVERCLIDKTIGGTITTVNLNSGIHNTTIHIDDMILHHLNPDRYDGEIEIMDAFQGHNLTIDDTLQQQLLVEGTKLVKISLKRTGLTTQSYLLPCSLVV